MTGTNEDSTDFPISKRIERTAEADAIPTKELLRHARKKDYELKKAQSKAQRQALKKERADAKRLQRAARDQELWQMLKPAAELEELEE